jgi:dephospho-CoA kinase
MRPPVIGILGGIASGKSFVARELQKRGAVLLSADEAGHEVLREPAVEHAAQERWGSNIFGPDGHIIRGRLADIVFAPSPDGARELAFLEQLTHPRISARLKPQLDQLLQDPQTKAVVLDAPVMIKAGWNKFCDTILFIEAPREQRVWRARQRGWSQEDFDRREAVQESLNAKRDLADVVIDNSASQEQSIAQIEKFWLSLTGSLPPTNPPLSK